MFSFSERVVVRNLLLAGIGLALGVCSYLFGVGGMLLPLIFCVTSFWVFVYSPRLLLRGGSADLKLPIIALLVIPTVSVLFALSTEIREVQDYLLQFYRQDLQGVLIGSAATASSLEANGLKEQADTIRLAVAAAVPGWVVFGIWLVVAVFRRPDW